MSVKWRLFQNMVLVPEFLSIYFCS